MENLHADTNTLSTNYADSEDTEVYELEERTIGTLTFINNTEEALPLNVKIIKTTTNITKKESSQVPHNKKSKVLSVQLKSARHMPKQGRKLTNITKLYIYQ